MATLRASGRGRTCRVVGDSRRRHPASRRPGFGWNPRAGRDAFWDPVVHGDRPRSRDGRLLRRTRAEFSPKAWTLDLLVRHEGVVVGCQGFHTRDFLVTRTGETGSWLGRPYQGRGIGTLMRQAICVTLFDHLGAEEITSAAFLDNPASLAVSRKLGYVDNGQIRRQRREGELAVTQQLLLRPDDLVRPMHPVHVEGAAAVRQLIGLPA
jgi:RimJ/RimL family protein N-acetyltransferase